MIDEGKLRDLRKKTASEADKVRGLSEFEELRIGAPKPMEPREMRSMMIF